MTNLLRVVTVSFLTTVIVLAGFAHPLLAQSPIRLTVHAVSVAQNHSDPLLATKLFQLSQGFGALPPVDGQGFDEWPCFAGSADCSSIASGGVVIGTPAYTWSLANCDANNPNASACGQIFWFYEDDTGDHTDHLVVSIVGKQGTSYVLDTGNFDFGPNPFANQVTVIDGDLAFGTLGQSGKGNGLCRHSNKTCVDPVAGVVSITVTTTVGAQKLTSKFNINLQ